MAAKQKRRRTWGIVDKQRSGRYRARYTHKGERHTAPDTFDTVDDADLWLAKQRAAIADGSWMHPDEAAERAEAEAAAAARRAVTFGEYADRWVKERTNSRGEPLRPRTRKEYVRMLTSAAGYLTEWRDTPLAGITPDAVRAWRAEKIDTGHLTQTARAYDLMKSILRTAIEDGLITDQPCKINGGSLTKTGRDTTPPTDEQLDAIIEVIDERYKALVVIAAAGGLRFGECLALTTDDVVIERDEDGEVDCVRLLVTKSVVEGAGLERVAGPTKTTAGERGVAIFGRDAAAIARHVDGVRPGGLLWTDAQGGHVSQSSVNNWWWKARALAGCPEVSFHSLRHYQGTRYARTGATLAEIMARLGHGSVKAAMRYQHDAEQERLDELARRAAR